MNCGKSIIILLASLVISTSVKAQLIGAQRLNWHRGRGFRSGLRGSRLETSGVRNLGVLQDRNRTWTEFNTDRDDVLTLREFTGLCRSLFQSEDGNPYEISPGNMRRLFETFDSNSDGRLSNPEFSSCFSNWISRITNPVSVLVVVDVQNDFISGSIALRDAPARQEGADVIPVINRMVETVPFRQVYYSKDWHPPNHLSFFDNLHLWKLHESSPIQDKRDVRLFDTVIFERNNGDPAEQQLWPRHCVWNTWGAALDRSMKIRNGSVEILKGLQPDLDSYSAFLENDKRTFTPLKRYIDEIGATDVYVSGLAYDVCVGATTIDSISLGYRTVLVEDATRGLMPENIERTRRRILELNGAIVQSDEVLGMVQGRNRRPEMGLYLADRLGRSQN